MISQRLFTGLKDYIQASKKEAEALTGDAESRLVEKVKGLKGQVDQDSEA